MMVLSRYNLKNINPSGIQLPADSLFDLPERVLQFGTGVLLRGLPDFFIDHANKQGVFNGRIVVVKSTDTGDTTAFSRQDGMYTLCVSGMQDGQKKQENIINTSISRVLSAKLEWGTILECAHNPYMQVIISNTTEMGIQLVYENIRAYPPVSFPAKLLAFLFERFKAFNGSRQSGMVIVPTELIVDNGKKLEAIVFELAHLNGLPDTFINWLEGCVAFCNSLVDRIVPGLPDATLQQKLQDTWGYTDDLITTAEVYNLWAIEGNEQVQQVLSFASANKGMVIVANIDQFRELKLRLLNGTHTLCCAVAFLSGFATVKQAMDNAAMHQFTKQLMLLEIANALPQNMDAEAANLFGKQVLDRFANPFIHHQWLSIGVNYSNKLKQRIVPILLAYYQRYHAIPNLMATGFAAYILFMKSVKQEAGLYYGMMQHNQYLIKDEWASYFYELWQQHSPAQIVNKVVSNTQLWDADLSLCFGLEEIMVEKLEAMLNNNMALAMQQNIKNKTIAA